VIEEKTKRVVLQARMSPGDRLRLTELAQEQGRSLGELLSILWRENEFYKAQRAAKAETL
jgi:hypothetical protein